MIEINKGWYQITKTQDDGVTQIVTPEIHFDYEVNINKVYFIENEIEFLKALD